MFIVSTDVKRWLIKDLPKIMPSIPRSRSIVTVGMWSPKYGLSKCMYITYIDIAVCIAWIIICIITVDTKTSENLIPAMKTVIINHYYSKWIKNKSKTKNVLWMKIYSQSWFTFWHCSTQWWLFKLNRTLTRISYPRSSFTLLFYNMFLHLLILYTLIQFLILK